MNSLLVVLFVMAMTLLGKWLLFDDDTDVDDSPILRIVEPPASNQSENWSKSA
jgi:hypothetical protein